MSKINLSSLKWFPSDILVHRYTKVTNTPSKGEKWELRPMQGLVCSWGACQVLATERGVKKLN
jgi:hypothetical protein